MGRTTPGRELGKKPSQLEGESTNHGNNDRSTVGMVNYDARNR